MCKNYTKFGHIGLPRDKKKQRALWCYNARSVTNHIADLHYLYYNCNYCRVERHFAQVRRSREKTCANK